MDHLNTLIIVRRLGEIGPAPVGSIAAYLGVGPATVKRYIATARHMGADIVSVRAGGVFSFELRNWPACKTIVLKWIALEEARTFV